MYTREAVFKVRLLELIEAWIMGTDTRKRGALTVQAHRGSDVTASAAQVERCLLQVHADAAAEKHCQLCKRLIPKEEEAARHFSVDSSFCILHAKMSVLIDMNC